MSHLRCSRRGSWRTRWHRWRPRTTPSPGWCPQRSNRDPQRWTHPRPTGSRSQSHCATRRAGTCAGSRNLPPDILKLTGRLGAISGAAGATDTRRRPPRAGSARTARPMGAQPASAIMAPKTEAAPSHLRGQGPALEALSAALPDEPPLHTTPATTLLAAGLPAKAAGVLAGFDLSRQQRAPF